MQSTCYWLLMDRIDRSNMADGLHITAHRRAANEASMYVCMHVCMHAEKLQRSLRLTAWRPDDLQSSTLHIHLHIYYNNAIATVPLLFTSMILRCSQTMFMCWLYRWNAFHCCVTLRNCLEIFQSLCSGRIAYISHLYVWMYYSFKYPFVNNNPRKTALKTLVHQQKVK